MIRKYAFLLIAGTILVSCHNGSFVSLRDTMLLNGTWLFSMDTAGAGITERWYTKQLSDSVRLPGTLDENNKGIPNLNRQETMRLSRERMYEGMAWYQKKVIIPGNWEGRIIRMIMERTKPTRVWVDSLKSGDNENLLTPQVYDLSALLTPGEHTITIMVNNGAGSVPQGITGSHAWTEHTQTNWNGIIGDFWLEAINPVHIEKVRIIPDIDSKSIFAKVNILNPAGGPETAELLLQAYAWNTGKKHRVPLRSFPVRLKPGGNLIELTYELGEKTRFWSEFDPALYKLEITLNAEKPVDNLTADFGMREFSTRGTQFTINDIITFLRGKHDACVFPLTGHPPMDFESWQKVFRTAKSYGINFYRFHSWTPSEAAFLAADMEGIYMQPELPFWGAFSKDQNPDLNAFLLKEGDNIQDVFGNHASFVMFALGNELSGDLSVMQEFVKHYKSRDGRQLMAFGSNNYLGFRGQSEGEDYYAGCRIGADTDTTYRTHIRTSFSFADANDGGYLNGRYPSTSLNYENAIANCSVPALGTEVGQYQVYPNYQEMKKYTGVLKPWNFEVFKSRLEENHLSDQSMDFFKASGALSVICYRADIEMAMRTPGFGGFHLLDLQDFPGQGTALVGILDAFMDSKGLISPEEFSHFCNRVVPLLVIEKYCFTNNERLTGNIQVANYSAETLKDQPVQWKLKNSKGELLDRGVVKADLLQGKLTEVQSLQVNLSAITRASRLTFSISLEGTPYKNDYPIWVYPASLDLTVPENIVVSDKLDNATLALLNDGKNVLLFPQAGDVVGVTVAGLFTPDYWNYRMFKGISEWLKKPVSPGTLSILTRPDLPLFTDFPTEFHTNWQWWMIVKNSHPLILDNTPAGYRPLVQVVDNIERNHKLGLIFEFKVGKGKLLVCMADLRTIPDKPEVRQLYSSILKYMASAQFNPCHLIPPEKLMALFNAEISAKKITGVRNISYE